MSRGREDITSILICGVGGQGVLLASELLCAAALSEGLDVKKSEVHGMAQRGGSVVSHVRFGTSVASPLIPKGGADGIISFEYIESSRYLSFLKEGGFIFSNTQRIVPITAHFGDIKYPDDIEPALRKRASDVVWMDAFSIAKELGNKNVVNVIMLGALSHRLPFSTQTWEETILNRVPPKFRDLNLKAFARGREAAS